MFDSVIELFWRIARHPRPYRASLADWLWHRSHRVVPYPAYRHCVESGAALAKALGKKGITVIEFGVAGGNGLVALEHHAEQVGTDFGLEVDVVGFDSGAGLPPPADFRDLPYRWGEGYYPMDEARLRSRLKRAQLELGPLAESVARLAPRCRYPIAAAMLDVDYYSSTLDALRLFDLAPMLPRATLYFDDLWPSTPFTGEWGAINAYNHSRENCKIVQTWDSAHESSWRSLIFEWHDFAHPEYSVPLNSKKQHGHLPLREA